MTVQEKIWSTEGLLVDKNNDGVIDGLSVFIDLPSDLKPVGLLDFFARMGLETTALSYNFFEKTDQKVTMEFKEQSGSSFVRFSDDKLICFYENEDELSKLLTKLATGGSFEAHKKEDQKSSLRSLSDIWSFSGFCAFEEASPQHQLSLNIKLDDDMQSVELFRELCHFVARCGLYSTSLELPVTENEQALIHFDIRENSENVLRLLDTNYIELSGTVEDCSLALKKLNNSKHWSEEQGQFGWWEQEILLDEKQDAELWFESEWEGDCERDVALRILQDMDLSSGNKLEVFLSEPLDVRRDFKQYLHQKLPCLEEITVRSAFKTGFHWIREELLPQFSPEIEGLHISVRKESNENALELPIRWIQELYPIDEFIEKNTSLSAECVTFSLHDELDATYIVEELFKGGTRKQVGSLEVPISKMPYVVKQRFAYPSSGAVRLWKSQLLIEEYEIPTDRERFYLHYLQEFLPDLQKKIGEPKEGQGRNRPLFDRIELDVTMSEEEEKLGVEEERTSALEALYEDLYFNTLDFFVNWGTELTGKPFDAPGGIHPYMHLKKGSAPSAVIKVYKWHEREPVQPKTTELSFTSSGEFLAAKVYLGEKILTKQICSRDDGMPPSKLQNGKEVVADFSYNGLPIPVQEHYLESEETFDSAIKMTLFKKTLVIEAGHHSNEISSTPAVLKLMENSSRYLKDMNVIVIPCANPDGFQLLQKMIGEHPEWKHHAARYNAVGLEFAHVRYQQTIFGEANVLPQVMRKWAPDIVVDDHGIPAHEWVQPFAGYNSPPRFPVSYFLPSAQIYGIGRTSRNHQKKIHESNLEEIVASISSKLNETSIAKKNNYWKNRFIKYGHQWLPEVFPIEEAPGIHFYRQQSVTPEYPTVSIYRYPHWVAADIISEAADEVVYGRALEECINAHILFNEGILELLQKQETEVKTSGLAKYRERPIWIKS